MSEPKKFTEFKRRVSWYQLPHEVETDDAVQAALRALDEEFNNLVVAVDTAHARLHIEELQAQLAIEQQKLAALQNDG